MIPDRNKKIYFISLGCDKNRVDAEQLCYKLEEAGYTITGELDKAQIALINTCGFIAAAKEEGIEAIFDMVREKESGNIEKIVVTGCLSERHGEEMKELIPEGDLHEQSETAGKNDTGRTCGCMGMRRVCPSCWAAP